MHVRVHENFGCVLFFNILFISDLDT
jgi:hypothetical protein